MYIYIYIYICTYISTVFYNNNYYYYYYYYYYISGDIYIYILIYILDTSPSSMVPKKKQCCSCLPQRSLDRSNFRTPWASCKRTDPGHVQILQISIKSGFRNPCGFRNPWMKDIYLHTIDLSSSSYKPTFLSRLPHLVQPNGCVWKQGIPSIPPKLSPSSLPKWSWKFRTSIYPWIEVAE